MPQSSNIIRWLFTGGCFGVAVMFIAFTIQFLDAWKRDDRRLYTMMPQRWTFDYLQQIHYATDVYHEKHGRFPVSFNDLRNKETDNLFWMANEAGEPEDEWMNRLVFVANGIHPRIVSYGRDGKPGGDGLDRDLSSDGSMKLPPFPLGNFLKSRLGPLAFNFSFDAGVVAVGIFLVTLRPRHFSTGGRLPWFRLIVIAAISFLLAMVLFAPVVIN